MKRLLNLGLLDAEYARRTLYKNCETVIFGSFESAGQYLSFHILYYSRRGYSIEYDCIRENKNNPSDFYDLLYERLVELAEVVKVRKKLLFGRCLDALTSPDEYVQGDFNDLKKDLNRYVNKCVVAGYDWPQEFWESLISRRNSIVGGEKFVPYSIRRIILFV